MSAMYVSCSLPCVIDNLCFSEDLEAVLTSKFILMGLPFINCVNSCYLVVCKI